MVDAPSVLFVAVPTAVAAAASFGLASAVQQRATKQVPVTRTLDPRLLLRLAGRPIWLLSIATVVVGLALQVTALAFGPLVLVQPLLMTGVLFGAVFSAMLARRGVDRTIVAGAVAAVSGLTAFLLLARPSGDSGEIAPEAWLFPLAAGLALAVLASLVLATVYHDANVRVGALALATGVLYGVTAALIKVVTGQIRAGGIVEPFTHPALYVVCVVGPLGFLLSQNTFQQGVLVAPALAVITVVDPLVGVLIGVAWLDERVATGVGVIIGEIIAGVVLIAGIALLSHRATQLRHEIEHGAGAPQTWG